MGIFGTKDKEKGSDHDVSDGFEPTNDFQEGFMSDNADELQRHLANRQIQLIAIGGSIGTALFVTIGQGLYKGGPGSLFLAYTLYSCMLALVNNSIAEMSTAYPVSGGFIRLAGKWVDDAWGFMAGWNFLSVIVTGRVIRSTANVWTASMKLFSFLLRSLLSTWSSRSGVMQ